MTSSVLIPGTRVRTIRKTASFGPGKVGSVVAVDASLRWSVLVRFDDLAFDFPCREDELEPLS